MNEQEPQLLSDILRRLLETVQRSDSPVLRKWAARNIHVRFDYDIFDEEDIITTVRNMLVNTACFIFEPAEVSDLRRAYEEVVVNGDEYIRSALIHQRRRLKRLFLSLETDSPERKLRNLERSLQDALRELGTFGMPEHIASIHAIIERRVEQKMRRLKLQGDEEFKRVFDEAFDRISEEEAQKAVERRDELVDAYFDIKLKKIVLQERLQIKSRILDVMRRTEARLDALGESSKKEDLKPSLPTTSSLERREDRMDRRSRKRSGEVEAAPQPDHRRDEEGVKDSLAQTIMRIQEAI